MTTTEVNEAQDPTHCNRCRASLDRGWSERWVNDKRTEVVCFDCNDREQIGRYLESSVITTSLWTRAVIEGARAEYGRASTLPLALRRVLLDVNASVSRIQTEVKRFEHDVWFGGLQAQARAATHRGFRADVDGLTALVYSMCGRVMITIEAADESHSVTVIAAEGADESTMGIQGIRATEEQAVALLTACREAVVKNGSWMFKRDDKVGVI